MIENERNRQYEEFAGTKGDVADEVVIMPQYKEDPRLKKMKEHSIPPESLFVGLGWDEDDTTHRKHYRSVYNDELENNKDIFPKPSPFDTY